MTSLIKLAEHDLAAGWAWVKTEAVAAYEWAKPFVEAPLKAFEAVVAQDFWGAAAAFVKDLVNVKSLVDLETAFLNTVELLGRQILQAAQALGSSLLQTILGMLLQHATPAA